jgi:hypothetical protein
VIESEIANHIGALNVIGIGVECLEEPWILLLNELSARRIGPQLQLEGWLGWGGYNVLVVGVQVETCILGDGPLLGDCLVLPCLVDDLGNWAMVLRPCCARGEGVGEDGAAKAGLKQEGNYRGDKV